MLDLDWEKQEYYNKIPHIDFIIGSDIIFWEGAFVPLYKILKFLALK